MWALTPELSRAAKRLGLNELLGLSAGKASCDKLKPNHSLLGAEMSGPTVATFISVGVRADIGQNGIGQSLVRGNAGGELVQHSKTSSVRLMAVQRIRPIGVVVCGAEVPERQAPV